VRVVALAPRQGQQLDLFINNMQPEQRSQVNAAVDDINQRYGEFTLAPARLLQRSSMPNVIAPAWKPSGLRKTI
jgi:DNA polymerase-4